MLVGDENAGTCPACRQPCARRGKRQDDFAIRGRGSHDNVTLPRQTDPMPSGQHGFYNRHSRQQTAALRCQAGLLQRNDHIDTWRSGGDCRAGRACIGNQPHRHFSCACMTG